MDCCMFGTTPLFEPIQTYCRLKLKKQRQWNLNSNMEVYIQGIIFENVICQIATILFGAYCVDAHEVQHITKLLQREPLIGLCRDLVMNVCPSLDVHHEDLAVVVIAVYVSMDLLCVKEEVTVNTFGSRRNRRHFADDVFKWILLNENVWMSIKSSLKFNPKVLINNITALV